MIPTLDNATLVIAKTELPQLEGGAQEGSREKFDEPENESDSCSGVANGRSWVVYISRQQQFNGPHQRHNQCKSSCCCRPISYPDGYDVRPDLDVCQPLEQRESRSEEVDI